MSSSRCSGPSPAARPLTTALKGWECPDCDHVCSTDAEAEINAAWQMIEQGWDIESREELERQAATNGFKFGLAQAVHHMWKRCVKENPDWLRTRKPPSEHGND